MNGRKAREQRKQALLGGVNDAMAPYLRFGVDQDLDIQVEVTGPEELHCFRLHIGGYKILMHGRSLIDLQHKLSIAFLDWQFDNMLGFMRQQGYSAEEIDALIAARANSPPMASLTTRLRPIP